MNKDLLLSKIRQGADMTRREQIVLAAMLSVPAMLAQLVQIVMEYIDAAMVGSLGAEASASIGLVSSTIWLFGGLCHAFGAGFSVQVAHQIGANRFEEARHILRQSLLCAVLFSVTLAAIGVGIARQLPHWLGGAADICHDATIYFAISAAMLPFMTLMALSAGMLRSAGNVKVPSVMMATACLLDVIFNWIFIFRMGWGVFGAAVGSALAYGIVALAITTYLLFRSETLRLSLDAANENKSEIISSADAPAQRLDRRSFVPCRRTLHKWWHIAWPMGAEHFVMCAAHVASTVIIAPLGTIAIAANSFGIIVESLCYMPGHGVADAATTLVGQSLGAQRKPLARSFAHISVGLGMAVMTVMGIVMYLTAPAVMSLMTPDDAVQALTTRVLRIEAFAEPMFAAQIVCYGVFVGAGDTLIPCGMNLASIWVVRISLALIFTKVLGLGLVGYWMAMAIELCFRGAIFLWRLKGQSWMTKLKM
ncbi:MAG: MATE family efflux transporter [Bacteroidales bacterium]|nr:MATE family efflux transporter [Bacteroidales bacterium]